MTKKERLDPDIIKGSHKKRIASGSGTTIQDVNNLLKQYDQTKTLMKGLNGGNASKLMSKLQSRMRF